MRVSTTRLQEKAEMKIIAVCVMAATFLATSVFAKHHRETTELDPCIVIATPEKYAERTVDIKGVVYSSVEELSVSGTNCKELPQMFRIWLAYPDESEVKADPTLQGEKLKFKRDKVSKKFDKYLRERCSVPHVVTTLRGRLQYKKEIATYHPDGNLASVAGYGQHGMYNLRLVIFSVIQVENLPCSSSQDSNVSK